MLLMPLNPLQQNSLISAAFKASKLRVLQVVSHLKCTLMSWTVERNDVETERFFRNTFNQHQIGTLQCTHFKTC